MPKTALAILRVGIVTAFLLVVAGATAFAAGDRPNALDHRVDAIPQATLLAQPATMLTDPERQDAAERLVNWKLPGWLLTALFEAFALGYFWRSGGAAALRDRMRRRIGPVSGVRFAFGAALGLIARLAALVPAFYLYRVERIMGLSTQLTREWLLFWLAHTLIAMLVSGAIATFVLWLVDRTHQWYIYTILAILAVSIAWSNVSPYFDVTSGALTHTTPAVAARMKSLFARAGLPDVPVYVASNSTQPAADAVIQGMGGSRRIVVPSPLAAASSPGELLYDVAFELGDVRARAALWIALIEAAIVIVGATIAVAIADRIGFRRDDDELSRLALVGALLAAVYLFAVPVRNVAIRAFQQGDDAYAVSITGDRAAAVRSIVRATDQRMDEVCPDISARLFLNTRPAPGARVAAINGVANGCP
jgi:hypothetical protein